MIESDESNMPPFIGLARPLSEVPPQKPDWDSACEAMRWLNDIEAMQGGRSGPTIKLRGAIEAMQAEQAALLRAKEAADMLYSELLPCGHHPSLLVRLVESPVGEAESTFCELCDAYSRRDDAEKMEEELMGRLAEEKAFVAALQGLHAGDAQTLLAALKLARSYMAAIPFDQHDLRATWRKDLRTVDAALGDVVEGK